MIDENPYEIWWRNYWNDYDRRKMFRKEVRDSFYPALGALLRKHRQQKGYTAQQVCRALGLSNSDYFYYEKGSKKISLYNFMLLCRYLQIDFHYQGTFCLLPEEKLLLDHFRHRNTKAILEWVLREM